ncbi:MAG: DUF2800 domain-containing protein [Cellulosilyticum sp.]|nr:DUF2800 domain-containing protein [Cellulosilyticum sp.]
MPDVHAKLSASGAKRWLSCPPSVKLEEEFNEEPSIYAEEGTYAHALAEIKLRLALGQIKKKEYEKLVRALEKEYENFHNQSLVEYVEAYVGKVQEFFAEAKAHTSDAVIELEQRVDFSRWVPEGFGTSDVVIIAEGVLHIIDLKFGQGVRVDAEDNPQLKLYALGAYEAFDMLYDIQQVKMTIIQPRLDHISSSELVIEDLLEWGENYVKPRADLAFNGEGEFAPGEHCRFCKAKAVCKARAEKQLELMKYNFESPDSFTDDELGILLKDIGKLLDWAKDVSDYMYEQATQHGRHFEGWKLVEGRSTRKYTDTIVVAKALKDAGYKEAVIYEKNLLTITAMEKVIGKKAFNEIVGHLIEKPQGKPVLVPIEDKRTEISTVKAIKESF